jgi:hypothetical protein
MTTPLASSTSPNPSLLSVAAFNVHAHDPFQKKELALATWWLL